MYGGIHQIQLSPAIGQDFGTAISKRSFGNPYQNWQEDMPCYGELLYECLSRHNDVELLNLIEAIVGKSETRPAVLISGFPVDAVEALLTPPRKWGHYDPTDAKAIGKKTFVAEAALLGLVSLLKLGIHINPLLQGGWFTQHVCVKHNRKGSASHAGAGHFPLHNDGAHLNDDALIDFLFLLTLRNGQTQSKLVDYDALKMRLLDYLGDEFPLLFEPRFKLSSSSAYETRTSIVAPIITRKGQKEIWRVQGNCELIEPAVPKDHRAAAVLEGLHTVLEDIQPSFSGALKYGDLLLVDNLSGALHTRGLITNDDPKDRDRHLLRLHGKRKEII
mmetsp:Transcript_460/g.1323  ORF Transcript_460/g.1323 Transcript_460/m.1323 type:complete len:332 (+) Transcript_460:480-1475(+)